MLAGETAKVGAPRFLHGAEWRVSATETGFRYAGSRRTLDLPPPGLLGRHQIMNAGTALAMLDAAGGFAVDEAAIRKGLAAVEWLGRLQRLTTGPLVRSLPAGTELWVDGAHNDSGGEVLAVQAAAWRDRPLDLVFGMLSSREPYELLQPLLPYVARLRSVAIPNEPASRSAEDSGSAAQATGIADVAAMDSVADAVTALAESSAPRRILICGSLYLAGAVLAENG